MLVENLELAWSWRFQASQCDESAAFPEETRPMRQQKLCWKGNGDHRYKMRHGREAYFALQRWLVLPIKERESKGQHLKIEHKHDGKRFLPSTLFATARVERAWQVRHSIRH